MINMKEQYTIKTKETLLDNIKRHNELYRKGTPEISDAEYDAEIEQLRLSLIHISEPTRP